MSFAILLAMIALSPIQSIAEESGGGGGNHGGGGGSTHGGGGGNHAAAVHGNGGAQGGNHQAGAVGQAGAAGGSASNPARARIRATSRARPRCPITVTTHNTGPNSQVTAAKAATIVAIAGTTAAGCSGEPTTGGCGMAITANGRITATPMWFSVRLWRTTPVAPSRSPIRPRTATLGYTLDGNAYSIAPGLSQEFSEIGLGWFSSAAVRTWIRLATGSSRAFIHLPVRTTVGNSIVVSCQSRAEITTFTFSCPRRKMDGFQFQSKELPPMNTVLLLIMSNVFMTFAWYGHLKYGHQWLLWKAILVSWSIARSNTAWPCPRIASVTGRIPGSNSRSFKRSSRWWS